MLNLYKILPLTAFITLSSCTNTSTINTTQIPEQPAITQDLLEIKYMNYQKDFDMFKNELKIPEIYFKCEPVLLHLIDIIDKSNNSDKKIIFKHNGDYYYTEDLSVCYSYHNDLLQFARNDYSLIKSYYVWLEDNNSIESCCREEVMYNGDNSLYVKNSIAFGLEFDRPKEGIELKLTTENSIYNTKTISLYNYNNNYLTIILYYNYGINNTGILITTGNRDNFPTKTIDIENDDYFELFNEFFNSHDIEKITTWVEELIKEKAKTK